MAEAALSSQWRSRLSRLVSGLESAFRTHGIAGAARKAWQAVRTKGFRGAILRVRQSVSLHAAARQAIVEQTHFDAHLQSLSLVSDRPAPRPPRVPHVVIVSDTTIPQCYRYRIDNKLQFLKGAGISATFADARQPADVISALQLASAVIFYRSMMDGPFMSYLDETERLGLSTYYDIDDPMFDVGAIAQNANTDALAPQIQQALFHDAGMMRRAMKSCDALIASTPDLAALMRTASGGKPAFVWRNVADQSSIAFADQVLAEGAKQQRPHVRLGYFSGSLAHEADFDIAESAIARLLAERDDVELVLFGHVGEREALKGFGDRVSKSDVADYETYLRAVAACDLVAVPLVDNAFNRCKSIVRFIDAALVETPVIASSVGDYAHLVRDGETGWLVQDGDWFDALLAVVSDPSRRRGVGGRARTFVETEYSVSRYNPQWDAEHEASLLGRRNAPARH